MTTMQRSEPGRLRLSYYFLSSLALHAALVGLVSLKSCASDSPPVTSAPNGHLVTVEITTFSPLPQPKTMRPGGGAPALRIDKSATVPKPSAPKPVARQVSKRKPEPAAPPPAPPPPEEQAESGPPVAAAVDAVAAPSRKAIAPPAAQAPSGTGPGSRGGPGGPGSGGGGVPVVSRKFAFGSDDRAAFKGIACFIRPGVLRIADVHGCDPVATFYTNTFDVPERQQGEGFPGITSRSSWFMIEYTGVFTVSKDGSYDFRLHSDDGSYLFIDGTMVIENDGKHQPTSRSGSVQLQTGEHRLKILYAQTTDRMALQLFVRVPGSFREKLFTPRI
jgi:PA14 domain